MMLPAVAVKLPDVEPAGTVTEAATGSSALLLERDTAVPPLGAAWASVTVQVDLAPEARLVGEHSSEDKAGSQFVTVIAPEVADAVSADPFANAATGLLTTMGTVPPLVTGERVTVAVATTPLPIVESVAPIAIHVTEPVAALQVIVLFALLSAVPGMTTTELTSPAANVYVHSTPAGAPPLPLNERFRATEPPSTAAPDERLREDVWLKATLPGRKQNRRTAIRCFV